MSNISGQLIKDSYNYVLQSDLISGIVYRIGGSIAENPKFVSGLTVNASFTYSDGSEFPGYVLTCDAAGNAVWGPVSGATSGVVVTGGTFDYSAGTLTLVLSNGVNVPISGLEDIYVTGGVVSGNSIVFSYNDTNTFQVTGITPYNLFSSYTASTQVTINNKLDTSGFTSYTASTQSTINNKLDTSGFTAYTATTQPLILNSVTGGTFSGGTLYLINNSGSTIPISGFTTGGTSTTDTFVTGFTLSANTITLSQNRIDSYSSFTISLSAYTGSSVSGEYLPLSGGTITGNVIVQSGLTANTISATTYYNLPISAVTNGTGISASTSNGTVTIINTAPDQTVLISGGSNIQITGSYPSFGVNFTGNTSSTGDYLPLSGGTVTGGTTFQSGLTANTISATTYYNYPDTYVTGFSLTNDAIILSQNRTDSYSSFTVTLSGLTGTSQQIAYYNTSGNLTGDTNFTRLDETNNFTTQINTVNFSNINEHQDAVYDYNRIRDRVFNDDVALLGETNLSPTGYFNIINNTTGNTFSGLDILETAGTFRYTDGAGNYNGFFYTDQQPGFSVERNGSQYNYFLPKSAYVAGGILTDPNGDGQLQWDLPQDTGTGGGGIPYYLNLSNSQTPYREFSPIATTAAEQSSGVSIANGVTATIAEFLTPVGYPNSNLLPGGVWTFHLHSYKQNNNASFNIFVEIYKRTSGGTETLLFTTDPAPVTTNSPTPSMQISDAYFSGTPLLVSDRLVAKVIATNTGNQTRTITLFTEGSQHYSYATTTFSPLGLTCATLSGCSVIQTIETNLNNKYDKSGGTVSGFVRVQPTPATNQKALTVLSENSSESIALYGLAGKGTNAYGVYCDVSPSAEFYTITNGIGGYFEVGSQFSEGEPTNKYSLQLKDGTEGLNKVLTSVTSDGKANWETPKTNGSNLYLFYNY
jgi:hypothetical protein